MTRDRWGTLIAEGVTLGVLLAFMLAAVLSPR